MSELNLHDTTAPSIRRVEIAVLDDDQDFLQFMQDVLDDEGIYAVRSFSNPLDLYASFDSKAPGILLLDLKMGEYQGDAVISEVQSRWPDVCIIVLTGYPSLEDMRAKFQRKIFDYLPKPFSIDQLRTTLNKAIETYGLGRSEQDILRERLGPRIRVLRTERNWSLKEFAGKTGLSVSQLSSIERGSHLPSIESLFALCHALEQKPSEIFSSIGF
ncbi:MAG: response regulator [Bryobacterales bacterium]|nr:response regulator [Bryobacterales bacterium]